MSRESLFPVVGIGASADGLRALEDFFKSVPAGPGMAFVIITHLAPDPEGFLSDILARPAGLPVYVASDGQKIEANRVCVLPPNASLTIAGALLRLHETTSDRSERMPSDVFFASLAKDCGDYAVGIVLSDRGHDSVLGVMAIKEKGCLVLAQSGDSSGHGFACTSDSAIASGLVDFAVPVEEMAAKLIENVGSFQKLEALAEARKPGDDHASRDAQEAIYTILRAQTDRDFSSYKAPPFLRRVERRIQTHHCEALARSYELLSHENWGADAVQPDLRQTLAPFFQPDRERIALSVPNIHLRPELTLSFGVIIDELANNAVKFGALSTNDGGDVAIAWSTTAGPDDDLPILTFSWRESGRPKVKAPERMGFGLCVIKSEIEYSHSDVVNFDFAETGFLARFEIPLRRTQEIPQGARDVNREPGAGP